MLPKNFIRVTGRFFALCLFLIITSPQSFTQSATSASPDNITQKLHKLTSQDGLPVNSFSSGIVQDSMGFIWIGTYGGGLVRYDGKKGKLFTHTEEDSKTITSNFIYQLFVDSHNRIWIFYLNGDFDLFDPLLEIIRHVSKEIGYTEKARKVNGADVVDETYYIQPNVFEDSKNRVWFVTNGFVAKVDITGKGNVTFFKNKWNVNSTAVRAVNETAWGNPLIVTNKEVIEADANNKVIKRTPVVPSQNDDFKVGFGGFEHSNSIRKNDTLYIPSVRGVNVYNTRSGKAFFRGGLPATVCSIKRTNSPKNDRFIFYDTMQYHLYEYKTGEGGFTDLGKFMYLSRYPYKGGLVHLNCLYDKSGVLWHGGAGENVFYGSCKKPPYIIEEVTGDFVRQTVKQLWHVPDIITAKLSFATDGICPWIRSPEGTAYVIDTNYGLRKVVPAPYAADKNKPTNKWEVVKASEYLINDDHFDKDRLWVANPYNMELLTIDTNGHTVICPKKIQDGSIDYITAASGNLCWATQYLKGLCLYSLDKGLVKIISTKTGKFPLPTNEVFQILRDGLDKNILWISTVGSGLIRFNEKDETWRLYTKKDGLPDNTLFNMLKDNSGFLWYGTKQGIYRFDTRKNIHKRIYTGENFALGSPVMLGSTFYFPRESSYILFYPDEVEESSNVAVALTGLKINNKAVEPGDSSISAPIHSLSSLHLSYNQNFISFDFAALDYNSPEKTQYRYRMEGIDNDWILNGTDNTTQYTSLPWGNYTFKVNATNADGNWSSEVKSIRVIISPPWWRTWWMYSIYAALAIAAGYFFFRTRLKRLQLNQQIILRQKEAEQAHAMEEMKSRFFANITHELRTPLTLIMSPVQKQLQENGVTYSPALLKGVYQNSKQLLRLINQLLDMSKLEAGKLNITLSRGDIALFIEGLLNAFRPEAAARNINLSLQHGDIKNEYLFDSDKLEKIIHNLVSNAFKFTPDNGSVAVALSLPEETNGKQVAQITVTDTGIGIAAEHLPHIFDRFYQANASSTRKYEGTGIGLSLVKELTTLMGGEIKAESTEGKGSAFVITLPLQVADNKADIPVVEYAGVKDTPAGKQEEVTGTPVTEEGKATILVTDDNEQLRNFIKESLSPHYNVITAVNGEEGLRTAISEIPELIISDVMMPVMDGYEFCHKAKENQVTSHISFILLTAKTADESRMGGLRSGADHYLSKPFIVEELLLVISNLLKRQQKLREFYSKQLQPEEKLPVVNEIEDSFLRTVYTTIEKNLDNPALDVEFLSSELAVTRRTLNRKLSSIANTSASEIIRNYRLKKAADLLLRGHTVTEAAYSTGFSTPSWFTQCFKELYGVTPVKYFESNSLSQN